MKKDTPHWQSQISEYIQQNSSSRIQLRGKQYFIAGKAERQTRFNNTLVYNVRGYGGIYRVEVTTHANGALSSFCTCPYDWGGLCKHEVAVLLDLQQQGPAASNNAPPRRTTHVPFTISPFYEVTPELFFQYTDHGQEWNIYEGKDPEFQGIRKGWATFTCIRTPGYPSITPVSVKFKYQSQQLATKCTCGRKVTGLCFHQRRVLRYVLEEFNNPHFFQHSQPDKLAQQKSELLRESHLPEDASDKFLEFAIREGRPTYVLNEKASGLYPPERLSKEHETPLQHRIFKNPQLDRYNIEAPITEVTDEKDRRELGFVFVIDDDMPPRLKLQPITGRPNKDRTSFNAYVKELEDIDKRGSLKITEQEEALLGRCHNLSGHVIHSRFGHFIDDDPEAPDYMELQKYYLRYLHRLFPLLEDYLFLFISPGNRYRLDGIRKSELTPIRITSTTPELTFHVYEEEEFLTLDLQLRVNKHTILVADQSIHEFYKHFLLVQHNNTLYLLANITDALTFQHFAKRPRIRVRKGAWNQLYRSLIQPLAENYKIYFSDMDTIQQQTHSLTPESRRIYLSEIGEFITFKPVVQYDNGRKAEVLKNEMPTKMSGDTLHIYERDPDYEQELLNVIRSLHPRFEQQFRSDFFHLHIDKMLENHWFFEAFEKLKEADIEVHGLNELKQFRYNINPPSFDFNVTPNEDWFDVNVDIRYGDFPVSLADVRKAVLNENKYIRLSDGSYGVLPEKWIVKMQQYLRIGQVNDEKIKISKQYFPFVDQLFSQAQKHKDIQKELREKKQKLRAFTKIETVTLPKAIKATLRSYQKEGYNWLHFLDNFRWGGILADDMGLGKTVQMLTFLQHQALQFTRANLIVVPTSLLFNWKNEIEKFAPKLTYHFHYGPDRGKDHHLFKKYNLVFTTYGTLMRDIKVLKQYKFNYIVLDESQAIKNPGSARYKAACVLRGRNKITLTGTPIENNTFDLYAQMNFVNPGMLGSQSDFKKQYAQPIDQGRDKQRSHELHQLVKPFVLRRTKEKVADELPDKTEEVLYCTMEDDQRKVYEAFRNHYRDYVLGHINKEGLNKSKIYVLEGLTKLRQICDSPALLNEDEDYGSDSVKIREINRHVHNKTGDHKILIFSQFVKMLQLIRQAMETEGISFSYLDGQTPGRMRKKQVQQFQEDKNCRVFLISLKAGGQGLNLTAADYVYLVDPWWNPAVETQAIDRTHRIGQHKKVIAYRMICQDTIEEKIIRYQQHKKEISSEIIQPDENLVRQLSKKDIETLFGA